MKTLNPKQQAFVDEYLIDLNATQAAIRAGYSAKGATVTASKLLAVPKVKAAVDAGKAARSERTGIDADFILKHIHQEIVADLADLYTEHGDLKPIREWPPIWRQGLVVGIEEEALYDGFGKDREQIGVVKKVRLSERHQRMVSLGKHVGVQAFQETVQHKGLEGLAERIARAKARDV